MITAHGNVHHFPPLSLDRSGEPAEHNHPVPFPPKPKELEMAVSIFASQAVGQPT